MSKKGDQLRQKPEQLQINADNIRAVECHWISLELATEAEEVADPWDAIELTIAGDLAAAKYAPTGERR